MASANPLNLFAAQSLDRAAPELASLFQEETGTEVIVKLGHSGFLRTEIEGNLPCDIFCSADTGHPKALLTALKATKGFVYARNRLVVVSREERRFMRSTWLSLLTDPSITIGISTPNVSPEGDWAKVLFKNVAKVYRSEPARDPSGRGEPYGRRSAGGNRRRLHAAARSGHCRGLRKRH